MYQPTCHDNEAAYLLISMENKIQQQQEITTI